MRTFAESYCSHDYAYFLTLNGESTLNEELLQLQNKTKNRRAKKLSGVQKLAENEKQSTHFSPDFVCKQQCEN